MKGLSAVLEAPCAKRKIICNRTNRVSRRSYPKVRTWAFVLDTDRRLSRQIIRPIMFVPSLESLARCVYRGGRHVLPAGTISDRGSEESTSVIR